MSDQEQNRTEMALAPHRSDDLANAGGEGGLPTGTVRRAVRPLVIEVARSATEAARELPSLARALVRLTNAAAEWLERRDEK